MRNELRQRPFSFFDDLDVFKNGFLTPFMSPSHPFPPMLDMADLKPFKNDVIEYDDRFEVKAELPGFTKEEISIKSANGLLTVSAKKDKKTEETKEGKIVRKEIYSGSVSRSWSLDGIDADNIKASFKDGILNLTLPKTKKDVEDNSKNIPIE